MKINSIQSVSQQSYFVSKKQYNHNFINKESNISLPIADNYGRAMVNFKSGKANEIKKMVVRSPLDDKLAVLLPELQEGEILVVSNSLKNTINRFKENLRVFDFPIKKILHIQESRLSEILAFTLQDDYGNVKFYNVNDEPINFSDLWMNISIEQGERQTFGIGARINTTLGQIVMKDEPETVSRQDIEKYAQVFTDEIDFENEYTLSTLQHNKKVLELELKTKKDIKPKGPMFKDVGGQDEVINALEDELILPLLNPKVFSAVKPTRFAILYGKPGTGKTFLAEAFANELGVNVIKTSAGRLSGSLVGESEKNCINLFNQAVENQPSVIFIDEINALTKKRGGQDVHGDKLLEQFLICTSEIDSNGDKVIVIGATNRIQDIDEAILRSGRFDLQLEVKEPDLKGTEDILKLKIKDFKLDKDVDVKDLAEKMYSKRLTGADITLIAKKAHANALKRTGLYKLMKERKPLDEAMKNFIIKQEDFIKAVQEFKMEESSKNRNPIGFRTSSNK